jgi:hypothetical protein
MIWKIIILLLNLSSTSLSSVPPFSNSSISFLIDPIPLNTPELSFRCITSGQPSKREAEEARVLRVLEVKRHRYGMKFGFGQIFLREWEK